MTTMTLDYATAFSAFVTVETADDEVFIGVPAQVDEAGEFFTMQTGCKGRPVLFAAADVTRILPVNADNPLIER